MTKLNNKIWFERNQSVLRKIIIPSEHIKLRMSEYRVALYKPTGKFDSVKGYEYVYFDNEPLFN